MTTTTIRAPERPHALRLWAAAGAVVALGALLGLFPGLRHS
jgi:hypothetical protein